MSTLMFWNKTNNNTNQQSNETKNGKKNWLHAPDALVNGHVAYLVKFLGVTPVDQAKGIETVKDAIRRLQFAQQIKKAEGNNNKIKKVEITISVDGVAIQEPRGTTPLHQFPLHDISYCADEKGVKKFFSFIAKTSNSAMTNGDSSISTTTNNTNNNSNSTNNHNTEDSHKCFVFISSKLASDITLTIGQAFELAYRRYMSDGTKVTELSKLQIQNKQLENSVTVYRQRLKDLMEFVPKSELDSLLLRYGVRDLLEVEPLKNGALVNGNKTPDLGIDLTSPNNNNDDQLLIETSTKHFAPIVPPRNLQNQINSTLDAFKPSVGTKLEGLLLNSDSDSDFDPRADESDTSSTIYSSTSTGHTISNDLFGFEPPSATSTAITTQQQQQQKTLGQQLFATNGPTNNNNINHNNNNSINNINHNNSINNMNNSMQISNGIPALVNGNGNSYQISPPPLLAPPPKAAIPRRSTPNNITSMNNINNSNGSQDLFGSTPFNGLQSSPFDVTNVFGNISSTTAWDNINNGFNESGICLNDSVQSNVGSSLTVVDTQNPFLVNTKATPTTLINNNTHQPQISTKNPFSRSGTPSINNSFDMSIIQSTSTTSAANTLMNSSINGSGGGSSNDSGQINYDVFRDISISSTTTSCGKMTDLTTTAAVTGVTTTTSTSTTTTIDNKPIVGPDLFKDAAAFAFKEFGGSLKNNNNYSNSFNTSTISINNNHKNLVTATTRKHENLNDNDDNDDGFDNVSTSSSTSNKHNSVQFSSCKNELTFGGFDTIGLFNNDNKNNFNNKTIGFDDFTLESLDPLRK